MNTRYTVFSPPIEIRIGFVSPELDELLGRLGASQWAYITAWNPFSGILSSEVNHQRHLELKNLLSSYDLFEGEGKGQDTRWPPERSWLIIGIGREYAQLVGQKFGQNAIVYGSLHQPAELLDLMDYD